MRNPRAFLKSGFCVCGKEIEARTPFLPGSLGGRTDPDQVRIRLHFIEFTGGNFVLTPSRIPGGYGCIVGRVHDQHRLGDRLQMFHRMLDVVYEPGACPGSLEHAFDKGQVVWAHPFEHRVRIENGQVAQEDFYDQHGEESQHSVHNPPGYFCGAAKPDP